MKLRRLYRHGREEPGQAVVEMALVLPILMLIILGIFKFGIVYNNYLQLTDATRTGARELAVERGQGAPCDAATAALASAAQGLGNTISVTMTENPPDTGSHVYTNTASGGVAGTAPSGSVCPTLSSGSAVTVDAKYPCDLNILGVNILSSCQLDAKATEQVE